jgi:DeoR/GlpR family transcriptional regulator of sugar metabolism
VTSRARAERLQRMLELLESRERLEVSELADAFSVSEVTVRQDLSELARQGLVARVRGGARLRERGQSELAFDVRLRLRVAEKRAIARAAASLVGDGEAIALDSSTTAYYLALELAGKRELVVVTNGLLIATALAGAPGISVILTGGMLRLAAMSVVGDLAAEVVRAVHIDKGFFGARGLSLERGLMDLAPEEVRIKKEMAAACERVIGIFDHTKWARSALLSFVEADRVDTIVTDADAPPDLVAAWVGRDVEVVRAEAQPRRHAAPERRPELSRVVPSGNEAA